MIVFLRKLKFKKVFFPKRAQKAIPNEKRCWKQLISALLLIAFKREEIQISFVFL